MAERTWTIEDYDEDLDPVVDAHEDPEPENEEA